MTPASGLKTDELFHLCDCQYFSVNLLDQPVIQQVNDFYLEALYDCQVTVLIAHVVYWLLSLPSHWDLLGYERHW